MSNLRVAHLQPITLDLYGQEDSAFGRTVRYFLSNLVMAQARLGLKPTVHLLSSKRSSQLHLGEIEVYFHKCWQPPVSAGMRVRFARQFSAGILRGIKRGEADIVHFHGALNCHFMYAAIACQAAHQQLPLVAHAHGYRSVGIIEGFAQKVGLRRSKAVLAANCDDIEIFKHLGMPSESIYIVPLGIDTQVFRPESIKKRAGSSLRILSVSRLTEEKDPMTMAEGVSEAARRGLSLKVIIIGRGDLREQVENKIKKYTLSYEHIDQIPQLQLPDYYTPILPALL